jgi:hypothetical protein
MHSTNLDFDNAKSFGDKQQAKRDNTFALASNIYHLPKSQQLVDNIVQKNYYCFMMTKIGPVLANGLNGSLTSSRPLAHFFAYNVTKLHQPKLLQPGRVGLISTHDVTHGITGTGKDPTGLGPWYWTRFQGNGVKVQRISVYCLCKMPGVTTTYQQQLQLLRHHNIEYRPKQAFYEDLYMECVEWIEDGNQFIIGTNAKDVRTGATRAAFSMPFVYER